MQIRFILATALVALAAAAPALAAPATVQLRVEGSTSTIFEGPVTTDGKQIDKGTGPHACDGAGGGQPPRPTMTSALDDGSIAGGFSWDGTWFDFGDFGIDRVGPDAGNVATNQFWGYALNFAPATLGGCQQHVQAGDDVLYAYDFFGPDFNARPLLRLSGPGLARTGAPVAVTVTNGIDGSPVEGATLAGTLSDAGGGASVGFSSPGLKTLKGEKAGSIRSNVLRVCVSDSGTDTCGVPATQLGASQGAVKDSKAPAARIASPLDGRRYRRGPRLLRGSATDSETAVTQVKLALRRHVAGHNCRWWSGRRERFVGSNCRKTFFFAIGNDAPWSYLLPRRLPHGHYVLDVKAFDRARNRDEKFVDGKNRVVFDVLRPRRASAAVAARRRAARVKAMVVGRAGVIVPARGLKAGAARVRVGGRRCAVPASTPLAVLARALAGAGVGYHVRDFGRCSRSDAGAAGQLFVDRVGADRNGGSDGWFYKVNHRAGSAGAADATGPFGHGRLLDGDEVLWFYCVFDQAASSCQRSLDVAAKPRRGRAGQALRAIVRAYDNERRGGPVAGAKVTLGELSAATDGSGLVRLTPPSTGRLRLEASKAGLLPAFPSNVVVSPGGR
jgi:hypothetical protein